MDQECIIDLHTLLGTLTYTQLRTRGLAGRERKKHDYFSRQESYAGAITLLTKEQHLPYDWPKLSKNLAVKAEQISLSKTE